MKSELMKIKLKVEFDKDKFMYEMTQGDSEKILSYTDEINQVLNDSFDLIEPLGYLVEKDHGHNKKELNCLVTIGKKCVDKKEAYFNEGDYLKGYFCDAICDQVMFSATSEFYKIISSKYKKDGINLSHRESFENDAIVYQKDVLEIMNENFGDIGIGITEGYMYNPVKTISYRYYASSEIEDTGIDHNCDNCTNVECTSRLVNLVVYKGKHTPENRLVITGKYGSNMLMISQGKDVEIHADCGGMKKCGKCKVVILNNLEAYPPQPMEIKTLSKDDIKRGVRFACLHTVKQTTDILLESKVSVESIADEFDTSFVNLTSNIIDGQSKLGNSIAIDIGTTTIVSSLLESNTTKTIKSVRALNPQKNCGADVVSRIDYANKYGQSELNKMIRKTLSEMIDQLTEVIPDGNKLDEIVISGNTTMIYLLLNEEPRPLGESPYKAKDTELMKVEASEILDIKENKCPVVIIPWLSAFVGGDIVSGLYLTDMLNKEETNILVDIGTNGEIALTKNKKLYTTSTAAGPAFEGANVKNGVGVIEGAINIVTADGYKTIGDKPATGICGTGIIDAIAMGLTNKDIDDTGRLETCDKIDISDNVAIYPEDIRQVQLSKGAIAAGIRTLLSVTETSFDEIDNFYIAGGFGMYLNLENAVTIGLIPKECKDKIKILGNTSLGGCVKYIAMEGSNDKTIDQKIQIENIQKQNETVELSSNPVFNMYYMDEMIFS